MHYPRVPIIKGVNLKTRRLSSGFSARDRTGSVDDAISGALKTCCQAALDADEEYAGL